MKLREELPQSVRSAAEAAGLDGEAILLSTHSDIDLFGNPQKSWLILTPSRLIVVGQHNGTVQVTHNVPTAEIRDARLAPQVGSGLLQVKTGEQFEDVVRFSNDEAPKFSRVAHKLSAMAAGKPVVVLPEDEKDERVCQSCGRPVAEGETICPRCVKKGRVILRMIGLMRGYWPYAAGLMVLVFAMIGMDLVPPRIMRILLDKVLVEGDAGQVAAAAERYRLLVAVVLALLGVHLLRYIVSVSSGVLSTLVSTRITDDMRRRMYGRLHELSVRYYDRQAVGVLMSRVTGDTAMLASFVDQVTSGLVSNVFRLALIGGWLFMLRPELAAWVLVPAPLAILLSWLYVHRVKPMWKRLYDKNARMGANLQAVLAGIRVVKAFGQEQRERERFAESSARVRTEGRRVGVASVMFGPLISLVFTSGTLIIWYLGGREAVAGHMTRGELIEYVSVLGLFYGPLRSFTNLSRWFTQFAAASHRIFEVLDQEPEVADPPSQPHRAEVRGEVEFENVEFGYTKHHPVLHNLSFRIKPGEMIGVVGRSGAGKTTMINLVCRFYDPSSGSVKIDGVDLRQWDRTYLRQQIGLVLQEPLLFRGTIINNLTYGRPDAPMEEVIQAAKAANAHDFIMGMPEAYETYLGEGGAGLSGGQRQRISIARALLTDPRILILDEATSSVDTESEKEIQDALAALCRGRTTIVIAHRLSTLRNSDRIFVLDRGELKEVGTHYELLARDGIYARLVRLQTQLTREGPSVDRLGAEEDWLARQQEADAHERFVPEFKGVRFLEPGELQMGYDEHGFPVVKVEEAGGRFERLRAYRSMPVTRPNEYISIGWQVQDGGIKEIGMLPDLRDLSPHDRKCVETALNVRYFVYRVKRINRLTEDLGVLLWDVETDRGRKQFSIGRDHSRANVWGAHGRIVRDMNDNRYVIPDMRKIGAASRAMFNRHIYWCPYRESEATREATVDSGQGEEMNGGSGGVRPNGNGETLLTGVGRGRNGQ